VVDTERRKDELLGALAPMKGNPAIVIDIVTAAEAVAREQRLHKDRRLDSAAPVEQYRAAEAVPPVEADLRRYFGGKGGAQSEEAARGFAARALDLSKEALRSAWALNRLTGRFSTEDLRALDAKARAQWLAMIQGHARALARQTGDLRRELGLGFPTSGPPFEAAGELPGTAAISGAASLARAGERLVKATA